MSKVNLRIALKQFVQKHQNMNITLLFMQSPSSQHTYSRGWKASWFHQGEERKKKVKCKDSYGEATWDAASWWCIFISSQTSKKPKEFKSSSVTQVINLLKVKEMFRLAEKKRYGWHDIWRLLI
jgi:hypothetical protein